MNFEVKIYIQNAALVIRNNFTPILIPAVIGILFYIPETQQKSIDAASFLPAFLLFVINPLIYGQYVEILLNNRQTSYLKIFNTHWFNYFVVRILITSPLIFLSLLSIWIHDYTGIIHNLISFVINCLALYVFPLVFLLRKRLQSISLGFKCLLGNFRFSLPIIILAFSPTIVGLLIGPAFEHTSGTLNIIFGYIFWLLNIFVEFLVFIAATLVLKEKLLKISSI